MSLVRFSIVAALALSVAACESGGLSMPSMPSMPSFLGGDKPEEKLPGRRISVLKGGDREGLAAAETSGTIVLPPPVTNASWSQPGGVATNAPGHLAAPSALHTVWTASIGEGASKRLRITSIPIVYDNKIFTLDAQGTVKATSVNGGDTVWSVSLAPEEVRSKIVDFWSSSKARNGFGGGIAAEGGKIFVASGFGAIYALEPASGKQIWVKKLETPIRQAPTAADGRLFVVDSESQLYCLNSKDGTELWTQKGLPSNAALLSSASPAVAGNVVFVPYPSGEVSALDIKTGQPKWTQTLAPIETNVSGSSAIGDAARPVVDREVVFAMSRGGKLIATSRDKGATLWSREISGSQMPWVAGDSIFVVDVSGKLLALDRKNGKIRWVATLPGGGIWSGPVLAGGKLWAASSKGQLISVEAASGVVASQTDLGSPITITPVVAEGRVYILTESAKLIAMS